MTTFKSIRQFFAKLNANDKRPGRKRRLDVRWTLPILTLAAFQLFARSTAALPVVIAADQQTGRFGPHSFPGWVPVGDRLEVYAAVESNDPGGSPTISVQAIQGGTILSLDFFNGSNDPLFQGFPFYIYHKFIDLDPALTGSWEITPTDSTGTGLPTFGDAITEPEFLPLVDNIAVQGTPLGARVSWTLPNLDGFDADEIAVRLINATSGSHLWQSAPLPVGTTSFEPPAGILNAGVEYVYGIILGDIEGLRYENVSWAFSNPFRFTIPGDFNTDGTVDAADYVEWRKNFSGDPAMYDAWRANFGTSLGPGNGSAGYPLGASAEPLSAAVPEPSSFVLLLLGALEILGQRRALGPYQSQIPRGVGANPWDIWKPKRLFLRGFRVMLRFA